MAKHRRREEQADSSPSAPEPQKDATLVLRPRKAKTRRRIWRVLALFAALFALLWGGVQLLGAAYHGPRTMAQVMNVMPGVPVFPLSDIAKTNRKMQRGMALPLLLLRWQGAQTAEAALLTAPGDSDFVVEWFRQTTPSQQWRLVDEGASIGGYRMVFLRGREGLQLVIGSTDFISTPVQYIYLDGMTAEQMAELRNEAQNVQQRKTPAPERPLASPPTPSAPPAQPGTPQQPPASATQPTPKPAAPVTSPSTPRPAPSVTPAPKPTVTPAPVHRQTPPAPRVHRPSPPATAQPRHRAPQPTPQPRVTRPQPRTQVPPQRRPAPTPQPTPPPATAPEKPVLTKPYAPPATPAPVAPTPQPTPPPATPEETPQ